MFMKNKNIIFKIRTSKVTDHAALINPCDTLLARARGNCTYSILTKDVTYLLSARSVCHYTLENRIFAMTVCLSPNWT